MLGKICFLLIASLAMYSLLKSAGDADREMETLREKREEELAGKEVAATMENDCRHNIFDACRNTCCKFCLGAGDCRYACSLNPRDCGKKVNIH